MNTATDRIQRQVLIRAPRARVWRALSEAEEFSRWFGVAVKGGRFQPGQQVKGRVTYPGYEHLEFAMTIERCEPESLLSWRWHPAAIDAKVDYSSEPTTLVVFELEDAPQGTLLRVTESGFDRIPPQRRMHAFRLNSEGWEEQMRNISQHVASG